MRLRIADSDPANVECVLRGAGARVDVVALASPRAWTFYDTTVVHQAQAFGSGRGDRGALPQPVSGMGNAVWIPSDHQLVATNGSESQGGSYVTVTITGRPAHGRLPVSLAKAVGIATLASAPRGSNPGPPPS